MTSLLLLAGRTVAKILGDVIDGVIKCSLKKRKWHMISFMMLTAFKTHFNISGFCLI